MKSTVNILDTILVFVVVALVITFSNLWKTEYRTVTKFSKKIKIFAFRQISSQFALLCNDFLIYIGNISFDINFS